MTKYINDNGEVYNGRSVVADGRKYINPSVARLLSLEITISAISALFVVFAGAAA